MPPRLRLPLSSLPMGSPWRPYLRTSLEGAKADPCPHRHEDPQGLRGAGDLCPPHTLISQLLLLWAISLVITDEHTFWNVFSLG